MEKDERIVIKGTFEHYFDVEDYPELENMLEDELDEWVEDFVASDDLTSSGDFYSEYSVKRKWRG